MIGHSADPDILTSVGYIKGKNNFQRMLKIIVKTIEYDVAQPCTDKKAKDCPDKVILDEILRIGKPFVFDAVGNEQIGDKKSNQIHKAVVSELKGSYLEDGWADMVWNMLPEFS